MASEWFCQIGGEELGPLSVKQLRAMAREGRLQPADLVRRGRDGGWVAAGRIQGLFSSEVVAPAREKSGGRSPAQKVKPADGTADLPADAKDSAPIGAKPAASAKRPPRKRAPDASSPKPVGAGRLPVAQPAPSPSVPPKVARPTAPAVQPEAAAAVVPGLTATAGQSGSAALGPRRAGRRRDNSVWVVVGLVVLVLALAVTGLGIYVWRSSARSPATPTVPAASGFESPEPGSEGAAGAAPSSGDQDQWHKAPEQTARVGDVTVKILSAQVGRPRVVRSSGVPARPREPYLILRLQLENLRDARKRDYQTWASPQMRLFGVRLTDNLGNTYNPKTFPGATVEGQLGEQESLYPHEPKTEVLVFERPVESEQLRYLRLELPATAFGESGKVRFEIPSEMIEEAPEPQPLSARPGTASEPHGPPAGQGTTQTPKTPEIDRPPAPPEQSAQGSDDEPPNIREALRELFPEGRMAGKTDVSKARTIDPTHSMTTRRWAMRSRSARAVV